jgi:signal transduction histidine kinase
VNRLPGPCQAVIMASVSSARSTWVTAAGISAAVTVSLIGAVGAIWAASADAQSVASAVSVAAFLIAFAAVGAVVAAARPGNAVGWVVLAGAALSALGNGGASLAHHGIVAAPGSVPVASVLAVAGQTCRSLGWYLLALALPMIFPTGSMPRPGWRWLRLLLWAVLVACVVGPITDKQADLTDLGGWTNPIGMHAATQVITGIAFVVQVPLGLVTAGGVVALMVSRWRQGDALLRQQLSLFVIAASLPVLAVPIVLATGFTTGPWVFSFTVIPLAFAIGFAVLARRLYDLRSAANRSLVWVTLSAVVAGVYALAIAGLGNQMGVRHATWLPWVAAGVVAVSFAPLRDLLQRGVNRVTFGRWDQPYDVLAALGQRLEASADVTRLLDRVVEELHSLDLRKVAICDVSGRAVTGDASAAGDDMVPLTAYGLPVGTLRCTLPTAGLRGRDRQLLDDLAGHIGGVLHAHALTAELQRARERLVLAREEERRRLRRDLHDGLGPSLAGHVLRLDVVARKVRNDPTVAADVDALRDELGMTMLDIRRVVEGLRPPALDELGLAGAVQQTTNRVTAGAGVQAEFDIAVPGQLPAAVEVAAYRIITEAVTNVVRHADASRCHIGITSTATGLVVEVGDDGRGTDVEQAGHTGHGLSTMRERAEELGGTLTVTSGNGTQVRATLPIPHVPEQASAHRLEAAL